MAIDMIEDNELSALSHSRIGRRSFINDREDAYLYANKKSTSKTESAVASIHNYWAIDPTKKDDCEYMQTRLNQLSNSVLGEMQKNLSKVGKQRTLIPLQDMETIYKNEVERLKCVQKQVTTEEQKSKQETLDVIKKASDTSTIDDKVKGGDNTTKYIIYGVGGAIAIVGLIILLKK